MTSSNPDSRGKEIVPYRPPSSDQFCPPGFERPYQPDPELWADMITRLESMMADADERDGGRAELRWDSDEYRKKFSLHRTFSEGPAAPCYTLSVLEMYERAEPSRLRVSQKFGCVRPLAGPVVEDVKQGFFRDDAENAEWILLCYLNTHPAFERA